MNNIILYKENAVISEVSFYILKLQYANTILRKVHSYPLSLSNHFAVITNKYYRLQKTYNTNFDNSAMNELMVR